MNFKKDLLLIDLETTGLDVDRHEIIQLAGVLLDKKTLQEKKSFCSYIKPAHWNRRDLESMEVNKIAWEQVRKAPPLTSVIRRFSRAFGKNVIVSYYVGVMDIIFLQRAYQKAGVVYPFDYHTFNIWSLFYPFLAVHHKLKNRKNFSGFGLEDMAQMFKIRVDKNQLHDALVDCRVEAEILRKVIVNFKKRTGASVA